MLKTGRLALAPFISGLFHTGELQRQRRVIRVNAWILNIRDHARRNHLRERGKSIIVRCIARLDIAKELRFEKSEIDSHFYFQSPAQSGSEGEGLPIIAGALLMSGCSAQSGSLGEGPLIQSGYTTTVFPRKAPVKVLCPK